LARPLLFEIPIGENTMTRQNQPAHILIVDDEPNVRLVFRTALESVGYGVSTAKDGEIVASVIARHAPPDPAATYAETVTATSQFAANLSLAKRALNRRVFDEAGLFLRQAIALNAKSAEAHNLIGVLHELRGEHNESFREYRAAAKADRQYGPAKPNLRRFYERFTFGSSALPVDMGESSAERDRAVTR
jgi:Flp pilus assembly protein TadD